MPYASALLAKRDHDGVWGKIKSTTKSHKAEKDGNSVASTVVHESLLRYYESLEPFQGFPGWLGAKEDLPDEQKILRKQNEHIARHQKPSRINTFQESVSSEIKLTNNNNSTRSRILGHLHRQSDGGAPRMTENHIPYQDDKHVHVFTDTSPPPPQQQVKHTVGMDFRAIYSNENSRSNSNNIDDSSFRAASQPPVFNGPNIPQQQSKNTFPWSSNNADANGPHRLQKAKTSNDLMSARLRGFGGNRGSSGEIFPR